MSIQRRVQIQREGSGLVVHIPPEFEADFEPGEAIMQQTSKATNHESARKMTLLEVLATFETIEEEFPEIEDLPIREVNI